MIGRALKSPLRVVHANEERRRHRRLLRDLERSIADGELGGSLVAPIVLSALEEETGLELASPYDPVWIITGIRLTDEYFLRAKGSIGQRDSEWDFAPTATPTLVGLARSLIIRSCEDLAARLRLRLIWPENPDQFHHVANAIYNACLNANELESDEVLLQLKALTVVRLVVGPK